MKTKRAKKKRAYVPHLGDEVWTSAFGMNRDETAKVRRIKGSRVEVIYGGIGQRRWVAKSSCRFVRKGALIKFDRAKLIAFNSD